MKTNMRHLKESLANILKYLERSDVEDDDNIMLYYAAAHVNEARRFLCVANRDYEGWDR